MGEIATSASCIPDRLLAPRLQRAQRGQRQHHDPQRQHMNQRVGRGDPRGHIPARRRRQKRGTQVDEDITRLAACPPRPSSSEPWASAAPSAPSPAPPSRQSRPPTPEMHAAITTADSSLPAACPPRPAQSAPETPAPACARPDGSRHASSTGQETRRTAHSALPAAP